MQELSCDDRNSSSNSGLVVVGLAAIKVAGLVVVAVSLVVVGIVIDNRYVTCSWSGRYNIFHHFSFEQHHAGAIIQNFGSYSSIYALFVVL